MGSVDYVWGKGVMKGSKDVREEPLGRSRRAIKCKMGDMHNDKLWYCSPGFDGDKAPPWHAERALHKI